MIQASDFKVRASQLHRIMAKPKSPNIISKGAMTFCDEWIKEQIYLRRKVFSSTYTAKGNICEADSIEFVSKMLDIGFLIKNEEHFEDTYFTGTPDILPKQVNYGIDVKNSWDINTFPILETKLPNEDYYWQAQAYMMLTGIDNWKISYLLCDTPKHLIESAARKYCYLNGHDDLVLDVNVYEMFEHNMTYKDIDDKLRIKSFDVSLNHSDIVRAMAIIDNCREYIDTKLKQLQYDIYKN